MSHAQLTAAIEAIFALSARVRHLEGLTAGILAQGRENLELIAQLKRVTEQNGEFARHVLRLVRHKEALFELVGRQALERQAVAPDDFTRDVERAMREMRGH